MAIIEKVKELVLTPGAIKRVMNGMESERTVVKILEIVNFSSGAAKERVFGIVSDGETKIKCFFSSKYNKEFEQKVLCEGVTIRIRNIKKVIMADKQYAILINEVLEASANKLEQKEKSSYIEQKEQQEKTMAKRKEQPSPLRKEQKKLACSIAELSPFGSITGWEIRVKVVSKSTLREYSTDGREGKIFRVTLMDKTGNISMIFFNEHANHFYSKIEVNKTYQVSGGQIKVARKINNVAPLNTYELSADKTTEIVPIDCEREIIQVPEISKISMVKDKVNTVANLLVVVVQTNEAVVVVRRKDGSLLDKRVIIVTDESEDTIPIVLWDEMAKTKYAVGDIILLQNSKISAFQSQPQVTILNSTIVSVNPEIPEAFRLGGWYKQNKDKIKPDERNLSFTAAPSLMKKIAPSDQITTLNDIKMDAMESALIKCTIIGVSDKVFYTSCPKQGCLKRVVQNDDSTGYFCSKCNANSDECSFNYYTNLHVSDSTDQLWISVFQEGGVSLFGMLPDKLNEILEKNEEEYIKIKQSSVGKDIYASIRGKRQEYKGEPEMKYTVSTIQFLNYKEESLFILSELKAINTY